MDGPFARLLDYLMGDSISNRALAAKAGKLGGKISARQVNNLRWGDSSPTAATMEAIAAVFEMKAWHMQIPEIPPEKARDVADGLTELVAAYANASTSGRELMLGLVQQMQRANQAAAPKWLPHGDRP